MSSLKPPPSRYGLARDERATPIGHVVAALGRVAQSDLLDRFGLRQRAERMVFGAARGGFRAAATVGRTWARVGRGGQPGVRPESSGADGVFDLTPTEDEQMLVEVCRDLAADVLRPAAAEANETCQAPNEVLGATHELGLPLLGIPEALGGIQAERSAMAGTLVAEALAHGDLGLAVAA